MTRLIQIRSFQAARPTTRALLRPVLFTAASHPHGPGPLPSPASFAHPRRTFVGEAAAAAVHGAQDAILALHSSSGLPWVVTIPLVALTVNTVFRLPLSAYTQRIVQRRSRVTPLLAAWRQRVDADVVIAERTEVAKAGKEVERRMRAVQKRVYRELGLGQWKLFLNLLSFPVWLVAIEAIRRICGGQTGLLGRLLAGDPNSATTVTETATDTVASSGAGAGLETAVAATSEAASSASQAVPGAAGFLQPMQGIADPSLTTEGALWFQDLTAADPYLILPFALVGMLTINLLPRNREARNAIFGAWTPASQRLPGALPPSPRQRMSRGLLRGVVYCMPLGGLMIMDMPAALHLYWLSSAAVHWGFSRALRVAMPVGDDVKPPKPCRGVSPIAISPRPKEGEPTWRNIVVRTKKGARVAQR